METIRGKKTLDLDLNGLTERLANHSHILLDLGTGDGRYAHTLAQQHPDRFFIGVDACRENLRERSQAKLPNMLFVIASAQALPRELNGLVSHISVNFPWGSLLNSFLAGDPNLMDGLFCISKPNAHIDILLNGGALTEAGTNLEAGTEKIYNHVHGSGWHLSETCIMDDHMLRSVPTTWAKRIAFGRDPRAMALRGSLQV